MTLEVKVTSGMSIPWGKKIQVRFYEMKDTGELGLPLPYIFDGLRTTVKYSSTWSAGNDSCIVEIYNASTDNEVALRQYQNRLGIQVYAGYISDTVNTRSSTDTSATNTKASESTEVDVQILFTGMVNTFYSRKVYTERVISFMCIPKSSKFYMKDIKYNTKGKDLAQVIEGLAHAAGWSGTQEEPLVKYHNIPDSLLHRVYGSVTFEGSFGDCISKVADQAHLQFAGRTDGLHVFMQNKVPQSVAAASNYITYEQSLAKSKDEEIYQPYVVDIKTMPVRSNAQLNMGVRYNPMIKPGVLILTDKLTGQVNKDGNPMYLGGLVDYKAMGDAMYRQNIFNSFIDTDVYLCQGAIHTLDTHSDAWDTDFSSTASIYDISDPGAQYFNLNSGRY